MKNFAITFMVALCICGTAMAQTKMTMTLAEAKQIAIEQNPTIAQAKASIAAAAAAVRQAESYYLPTLNLEAGYTNVSDQPMRETLENYRKSGITNYKKHYDSHSEWELGGTLSYTIFDGFKRQMNLLSANLSSDAAINQSDDTQRLLLQSVSYAFFASLLAQDTMRVHRQEADLNQVLLDDTEKRNKSGLVKPSEVKNFELKVGNAEVDYIEARNQWKVTCIALGELLGIVQEDIWENIELVRPSDDDLKRELDSLDEMTDYAFQHRPDYKRAQNVIDIYHCQIRAAGADYLPTVTAFATYGVQRYHNPRFNDDFDRFASYGLKASWSIFNGGLTTAQIKEAEANLLVAIHAKEELELSIRADIRQQVLNIQTDQEKLEMQNDLVTVAREIYDLVYEEYKGGRTSVTRVNDALNDLTIAELTASQFRVLLMNQYEQLDAMLGKNCN